MAFSFITRFLTRTTSEAAGFGLGGAMRSPLEPPLQELTNETWRAFVASGITVPTEPGDAAEIVAEDVAQEQWGKDQVAQLGYGGDQFDKLVNAVRNAPGLAELMQARRRGLISADEFSHGLRKARLETLWDDALVSLLDVLLSPQELANARQQGYIDQARQHSEASLQGVDAERAEIQYEMVGLPPGHAEAQQMLNRGLIDQATFAQMIREGHTKTKYTAVLQENARRWLTPMEWVDARLRGHATDAEMYAGTAAWGVTKPDTDVLFASAGRALSTHQITTALARGGVFNGPTDHIPPAYLAALEQGSIQPRYYNLDYANRYTLPSFFVIRALIQDGTLTTEQGATIFKQEGWPPDLADAAAAAYGGGTTAKADAHLSKAETQLWNTTHTSYRNGEINAQTATASLEKAGVPAASVPGVLAVWDEERTLIRAGLSASNIAKAYQKQVLNPATGAAWTEQEALAALAQLGWSHEDALTRLEI